MKIRLFLILVLCSITLSNCKKSKESSPDIPTSKSWHRGITDKEESSDQIKYYTVIPTGNGYEYLIFLLQ